MAIILCRRCREKFNGRGPAKLSYCATCTAQLPGWIRSAINTSAGGTVERQRAEQAAEAHFQVIGGRKG